MSRYRNEIDSLKRRIRELRRRLADLDRERGLGRHAPSRTGRAGYAVGRAVGGIVQRIFGSEEEELERLRDLEQSLAQRVTEGEEELAQRRAETDPDLALPLEPSTKPPLALRVGRALRRAWDWGAD